MSNVHSYMLPTLIPLPPRPQYLPLSPLADLAIVGRLCVTNPRCKCKRFYRSSVAPSTKWGPM